MCCPNDTLIVRRFTDFLVNEVDLDHQVVYIKSLGLPESKKDKSTLSILAAETADASTRKTTDVQGNDTNEQAGSSKIRWSDNTAVLGVGEEHEDVVVDDQVIWNDTFEPSLSPFLSESSIAELRTMYLEGPEPPRVSDNGWVGIVHKESEDVEISEQEVIRNQENAPYSSDNKRGKRQNARGGNRRQRGRGGRSQGSGREDHRHILSEVCNSAGPFYYFSHPV